MAGSALPCLSSPFGYLAFVHVISTQEAAADLARLLVSVEAGEEFVMARGQKLVAKLAPFTAKPAGPRPKVGEMISPPFEAPAPLTPDELAQWVR